MSIEQLIDKFYKENVQKGIYCHYENCEIEVDELLVEEDVFKEKLKEFILECLKHQKCSD